MTEERFDECMNKYRHINNGPYYTFISRKQIGVIFSNWKRGTISAPDAYISYLYNHVADSKGYINNTNEEDIRADIRMAIEALFDNNAEFAQMSIDRSILGITTIYSGKDIDAIKAQMNK